MFRLIPLALLLTVSSCQSEGHAWIIIEQGLEVVRKAQSDHEVSKWLRSQDNAIVFTTDATEEVQIYINDNFIGHIDSSSGLTCRVKQASGRFKVIHPSGRSYEDNFLISDGLQQRIFISAARLDVQYSNQSIAGLISGNRVNFRSTPDIRTDNILGQLSRGDQVYIEDVRIIAGNPSDRLVRYETYFHPVSGAKFKILKGIAVELISNRSDGYTQIDLPMKDGSKKRGYIETAALQQMTNKKWYQVEFQGQAGWVYGDFVGTK